MSLTTTSTRQRVLAALVAVAALVALSGCGLTPGDPGAADVRFTIDAAPNAPKHAISPLIYGTNGDRGLTTNKQTVVRLGGNRWTAYNWENNASNAGSDWCFQNDGFLSTSNTPGEAVRPDIVEAKAAGAAVLITVPIVDHVAADKNGGCDVRASGPDYLQTRFNQNKPTKGAALSLAPNAADDFVYQDEYVNWLKTNHGDANVLFSLDNEPDLWSSTHAEVHPNPVGYAELVTRNTNYAKAIKGVWPSAKVAGPVNYGFYGFERLQGAPDANNRNFLDFYLQQMKAADAAAGMRLVDYLDLHWYPEATGGGVRITSEGATSAAVVAARVQAPRSLWDPTYLEDSWIANPGNYNYGPIRLIPRTQERIAQHHPGTGLAFTEWNYGGGHHISGAVATADVLGIFGRERVELANFWELQNKPEQGLDERFAYAAFRAYRNYDGAGGAFGDQSIPATSSDVAKATVYASTSSTDATNVTISAINKSTTATTAGITVACTATFKGARVYTITQAGGANVVRQADLTPTNVNAFRYTMPPMSVSIIVPFA
jgi:hypothetical protein